jgi:AraC family transcriptional regulator
MKYLDGIGFQQVRLNPTPDFIPTPETPDDVLIFVLKGRNQFQSSITTDMLRGIQTGPGAFLLAPHHYHLDGRWNSTSEVALLHLSHAVSVDAASTVIRGDPAHIELQPLFNFHDSLLRYLCLEIVSETQHSRMFGSLYIESIVHTISLHLLRTYSNRSVIRAVPGSLLSPNQQQTLVDYIEAHLHEKISLTDLAHLLKVSVPHFEKMFRVTFHCAPYRYVLERRLEKARLLLSTTQLSVVDVALDCGFANQSHFTRHFTRWVGITPARFARASRR